MSGPVKGGLFVGAAVAVGIVAGLLLPSLVVGGATAERQKPKAPAPPAMPDVVGLPLDEAELRLSRREIAHVTDEGDIFGVVVPSMWEVCETEPVAGQSVRGTAQVRAALTGTCRI
jgi:hypothetical protein